MKQKKLILVKLIGIGNDESKRINNDDKDENDSIEKEGYKYNEDKCNNKGIQIFKKEKFFIKRGILQTDYVFILRYSFGSIPTSCLNTLLMYLGSEKPAIEAI